MAAKKKSAPTRPLDRNKLMERIEQRFEQLDEELDDLEARLLELDFSETDELPLPRKPR